MIKEFDKKINGTLTLESVPFERVLCRKVIKSNERGSKVSIPKELNLEGKFIFVIIPKGKINKTIAIL